ncbi:MAG: L-histidine N(alpha)-methyltransferase [Sedimenticola thiotaurini]|uniref:L-histidine N(Alpha)-methyltransferase n=1 Tax=Sedimenticola thiotaurini TaxID=1543721 RepID=A0A558DAN6_9GAMM|nr:MAG: L-histidine N(alpha)-methyltransferase [Sedimenticola thiotaurini]
MSKTITFHDHHPQIQSLKSAVIAGLSKPNKSIPPKYFYDERGSKLFAEICEQPEYYPPNIERALLSKITEEIFHLTGTNRLIIEPGAGSATKIRILLDPLKPSAYLPMDISCEYLRSSAAEIADDFPWLPVHAVCVDFTHSIPLPDTAPKGHRMAFFPGSSIGNFTPHEARSFLEMVRQTLSPGGLLLIGVDTKKPADILNAAYNDAAGITAAFNLNLLHRIRDEVKADCNPENFEHLAFYNQTLGRIEMHLISRCRQTLHLSDYQFQLEEGESIHTENSYKYTPDEFIDLATQAGLQPVQHWLDDQKLFALYLLQA